ncbi:hypothetical protein F4553_004042 [Allocatelliglobosispora scoriae]|uniref:Beta-lactamase class A catalytic domain-containing protein n=1 Tax=Allocatelliglobosispora scoriae TaxID=643052 RepID=A0A841BUS1_9ACTN|nr:serine hydrolase [Allocatelliglobosispora scoriae]MBB5870663.1 hypothetical protein [Allocatelliglobosispora scoriae]
MKTRLPLVLLAVTAMSVGGTMLFLEVRDHPRAAATVVDHPSPSAAQAPSAATRVVAQGPSAVPTVSIRATRPGFFSWALLDRRSGTLTGSSNLAEASDTMSMVKVWLAADYLTTIDPLPTEKRLRELTRMIVDSDNAVATETYARNGGAVTITRMAAKCGLTESSPRDRWSTTVVSARDVARLGDCIADGTAAGPRWTKWLLTQMRGVRGEGDFGARTIFDEPERSRIAIKNGWFMREEDKLWHMSCLAISETWSLGILVRYPSKLGMDHGQQVCHDVAAAVLKK